MIDWDRPYGKVCGVHRARYEQDGRYFNAKGEPLEQDYTQQIIQLKAEGLTNTQIGEKLNITRQKVTSIARTISS